MQLPACVPCKRARRFNWNGRIEGAMLRPPARPAVFLVTIGRSQVERFECLECQEETGNPIKVRLLDTV